MKSTALWFLPVLLLSGCSIVQTVTPVKEAGFDEVCIIENPAVRSGFLEAYRHALEENGYKTRVLPKDASVNDCDVTTIYVANWRWDVALYMQYAHIKVFRQGHVAGEAVYDSTRTGARVDKFIKAEAKVQELTSELFPKK